MISILINSIIVVSFVIIIILLLIYIPQDYISTSNFPPETPVVVTTDFSPFYKNMERNTQYFDSIKNSSVSKRIITIGDSTTMGWDNPSDITANGWPNRLSIKMNAKGIKNSRNSFIGFGYNTFNNNSIVDNRLIVPSNWTVDNDAKKGSFNVGGSFFKTVNASNISNAITFTTNIPITNLEIFLPRISNDIILQIDQGSTYTFSPSTQTNSIARYEIADIERTNHKFSIWSPEASSSTPAFLSGIIAYDIEDKFHFVNPAVGASSTYSWLDSDSNIYNTRNTIQLYRPSLVTINLGINDYLQTGPDPYLGQSLSQYKENYTKLIQSIKDKNIPIFGFTPSRDPLFKNKQIESAYIDVARQVFNENEVPYFDMFEYQKSDQKQIGEGNVLPDQVHYTAKGYDEFASALSYGIIGEFV